MLRSTSMPLILGMRISRSTMSGAWVRIEASAWGSVFGQHHVESLAPQAAGQHVPVAFFIVYNQQRHFSDSSPPMLAARAGIPLTDRQFRAPTPNPQNSFFARCRITVLSRIRSSVGTSQRSVPRCKVRPTYADIFTECLVRFHLLAVRNNAPTSIAPHCAKRSRDIVRIDTRRKMVGLGVKVISGSSPNPITQLPGDCEMTVRASSQNS